MFKRIISLLVCAIMTLSFVPAVGVFAAEGTGVLYGDVNGDKEVTSLDIVRLKRYLAYYDFDTETSSVEISEGADANGDGKIDALDIVRLKRYFAEFDYETGKSTVRLGPLGDNEGWSPDIL